MQHAREFVRDHKRETAFRAGYDDCASGTNEHWSTYAGTPLAADYDGGYGYAQCDKREGRGMSSALACAQSSAVLASIAPDDKDRVDLPAPARPEFTLVDPQGRRYKARHRRATA